MLNSFIDQWRRFKSNQLNWRAVTGILLIAYGLGYFLKDYSIGIDLNEVRCLPWRVYFLHPREPGQYKVGDLIGFISKNGLMGAKFEGQLIGKRIAALPGDLIEVKHDVLYINNRKIADLNPEYIKKLHRLPGGFDRKEIIPNERLLVLGDDENSFDGRYWGTLSYRSIVGSITPIY